MKKYLAIFLAMYTFLTACVIGHAEDARDFPAAFAGAMTFEDVDASLSYSGAFSSLLNYATLYAQNSPWAQKATKAAYANSIVGR